jgi:hypothetical protein
MKKIKRVLLTPIIWVAAIIFLIEEFIWDATASFMAKLGAFRYIHAIEIRITKLQSHWALFAFLLPSSILIPAKLIGLHAIANGHWLLGGLIFAIAKISGMALFSRIFNLTRPALLKVLWFSKLYEWVMFYRNRIHAYLNSSTAYQNAKRTLHTYLFMMKGNGKLFRFVRRIRRLKQIQAISK